jgi:hypothetical protein
VSCHDSETKKGGLDLNAAEAENPAKRPEVWEKVVRKLRGRQMPPPGRARPTESEYAALQAELENRLDRAAQDRPAPGRTAAMRRLNRTEYQNAIRDLLALEINAAAWLPNDETSHGFDRVEPRGSVVW